MGTVVAEEVRMETVPLFGELAGDKREPAARAPTSPSVARVVEPVRTQVEMVGRDLDSFVAEEHPARAIWALLERLDLSGFYAQIGAVVGTYIQDALAELVAAAQA